MVSKQKSINKTKVKVKANKTKKLEIDVVELFAGVGGFRLGLEGWDGKSPSSSYTRKLNSPYKVVWSNQFEPSTKTQHATLVYENRFGKKGHSNLDIAEVQMKDIPKHNLLVGGFPCQDYSVATTLRNSKGLLGKKGVLWWSIHRILSEVKSKPEYLMLENVDRLLISPSGQRGRDFAIILQSLNELGYAVEWRVINAAEYGMPQRRRRVFILGYLKSSSIYKKLKKTAPESWMLEKGVLAKAFKVVRDGNNDFVNFTLDGDLVKISDEFNKGAAKVKFENTGLMVGGKVCTKRTIPETFGAAVLGECLDPDSEVPEEYYIDEKDLPQWKNLKGAKKLFRLSKDGFQYEYSEGAMAFPDPIDKPARTIITGEGGKSPSRFKHVVKTQNGYRRLTPRELERLNMFPPDHTKFDNISDTKRAFFMGNALVVGIVERLGVYLAKELKN